MGTSSDPAIQAGDHVYIGAPGIGKVHWEVADLFSIANLPFAELQSGMSGRRRFEPVTALTLHTRP